MKAMKNIKPATMAVSIPAEPAAFEGPKNIKFRKTTA